MDLLERFDFHLLSSNNKVDWSQVINRILEKGEMVSFSRITLNQTADRAVLLDIQGYPLIDSASATLGAAFIFTDVTKAVILEKQIIQTEKVQSVAELGANLAHEIRNPLNAISLNAQLLKEEIVNKNQPVAFEVIELILQEIRRLDHLISDFLEFARPKQPRMILGTVTEPLNKSLSLYRQQLLKKNIELKKQWKEVDLVYHDPEQLQQVFNNILENAIQWTPESGTITIQVKEEEGYVVVTFIDSGPGIAPQILDRIFDVFYSKREGGIGVGLAIVRSLLKGHHGKVSAKNHKKGGAQFDIYLPLRRTALGLGIIPLSTSEKTSPDASEKS